MQLKNYLMQQKKLIQVFNIIICSIILSIFAFYVNFYYGSLGLFPIDSLSHFDTGYRITLGEYPFKDYWAISGPAIDYIQAIFFYFFGVSWNSYILHTSLLNLFLSLFIFFFFLKLKVRLVLSFFFSICFSILAYPSSGTPFVDHHATFFSLIGICLIILNFERNSKFFSFIIPIVFFISFFSKQVPSSYVIFFSTFFILLETYFKKNYQLIKYYFFGTIVSLIIILIIGYYSKINLQDFLVQYIYYPPTIGSSRINALNIEFKNFFLNFKLIWFLMIPIIFINIKNFIKTKNIFKEKKIYTIGVLASFVFSLIFHQLITLNQIFIFFLIPILAAFLILELENKNYKTFLTLLIVLFTIYSTQKYHLRFNENRKFHELVNIDLEKNIKAEKLDYRLKNLKWITPLEKNPNEEIKNIKNAIEYINSNTSELMVITNYSFFSALTHRKLHSPIRWFIMNGNSHPLENNKYYDIYKKFLLNKILNNKIVEILSIGIDDTNYIEELLSGNCIIIKNKINSILISHLVKNCAIVSKNDYKKS